MKKHLVSLAVLALALSTSNAGAQSLSDILNSSVTQTVVSAITGGETLSAASIAGTWYYSGPAVKLTSDNAITEAAGTLATSQIESKLSEYFATAGITTSDLYFTFDESSNFSCTLKSKTISGTYTLNSSEGSITLQPSALSQVGISSMTASTSISSGSMEILFDANVLLSLVSTLSSVSGNSTLQSVNSLLEAYDGIQIGFEMSQTSSTSSSSSSTSTSSSSSIDASSAISTLKGLF